jgi:acyl dehydratase
MLFFEDIDTGETRLLGPRKLALQDSLDFSNTFDRLPIHVDPVAAEASMFGGLIASGLHTLSLASGLHTLSLAASLVVDEFLVKTSMTGASGMTDVRWFKPVFPPQDMWVRLSAVEKIQGARGKSFGTVVMLLEALLESEVLAMSAKVSYLFRYRCCRSMPRRDSDAASR